jgi:hypothetical protein
MTQDEIDQIADAVAARLAGPDRAPLLRLRDVAVRLAISERTVRELVNGRPSRGKPPVIASLVISDGLRRIEPAAVDAYIACRGEAS